MARKRGGRSTGVWFAGCLLGAAIGAAVALVYSPGTGDENRRHLVEWVKERTGSR